ncbi:nephrin-like [Ptychodera flava]|uniref:nephrin-like n=1 Tax=Ptychodera flava TaxID=63121 RepID=UPI00396A9755
MDVMTRCQRNRSLSFTFLLIPILHIIFLIRQADGQVQSFSIVPVDTSVIEGHTAYLNCSVQNKVGTLQWTKDGFALGASRGLPGYARYRMTGNEGAGEYFLEIREVKLEDDSNYVCQVSAMAGSPTISTRAARLNVLMAPDPPTIVDHSNGTSVIIRPPATVVLTCRSENGKPAATLKWLQNDRPIHYEEPTNTIEVAADGKREHAVSTLTLQPEKEDNGKEYKCIAEHEALMGTTLFTMVKLSVQFVPDEPVISGYNEGNTLRSGEEIMLTCTARGGNPLAQVTWWRNGELVDHSYKTDGTKAINPYEIKVGYSDNNARFTCRADNVVSPQPMEVSTTLTVYFTPEYVNISGYDSAVKAGDQVTLKCTTAQSNPESYITWLSAGRTIETHEDVVVAAPNGGFITSQELTVNLTAQTDKVTYTCQATNVDLLQTVSDSITVSVLHPPNPPTIDSDGPNAEANAALRMSCRSIGGNPLATLTWLKDGVPVEDAKYATHGNIASSELRIILDQTDNGAMYSCNASNPATPQPLSTNITLSVNVIPPANVVVRSIPDTAREGDRVVIECTAASSNPASAITWMRDGVETEGIENSTMPAENGGFSTVSHLIVERVAHSDNEKKFLCKATNLDLQESANDAVTLNVQYAPVFLTPDNQTLDCYEKSGNVLIDIKVNANPSVTRFVWYKDSKPIDIELNEKYSLAENGSLIIHNATKDQAGKYMCEANNDEGKQNHFTDLNVFFAPAIQIEDHQVVSMGKTSPLQCTAVANPMPENFIHWTREGYNITMYKQHYTQGTNTLVLTNITKAHAGPYVCHADNGIGPKATKVVQVIVQYAPKIDKTPSRAKVATNAGKTAYVVCAAEGAPSVKFRWIRHGKEFNSSKERYTIELYHKTYSVFYESRLTIVNVKEKEDFGAFKCEAYNNLGSDSWNITLESTDVPDPIQDLRAEGKTDSTITLSWTPGFNGGLRQSFHVRYNIYGSSYNLISDVMPSNATTFVIVGLRPSTKYRFNVRASNDLGKGPYGTSPLTVTTDDGPVVHKPTSAPRWIRVGEIPLYVIVIIVFIGALCLLFNLCLICCLIRRHKRKKAAAAEEEDRRNIELYKPAASSNTYATQPGIGNYDDIDSYESDYDRSVMDYPPQGPPRGMGFYNDGYHVGQPGPGSYDSWDDRGDDRDMYRGNPDYDYSGPPPLPVVPEDRYEGESPPMSEEEEYAEELRRRQAEMTRPRTPTPASSMYASLPREALIGTGDGMEGQFV